MGLLALAAAVLMTWPLAARAKDHILRAMYFWDAYANTMIMGSRVDAAVGRSALSLYDDYFFAPLADSIVFNENHFGLSLLFAPVYLLSHNPLLAYNWTLLVSMALSVFFTDAFVRRITGSDYAGLIAGVAFAFCPYVMFEAGRIQLVATQWIPACFLTLHLAIEKRRLRDLLGFWGCTLLQIGTCLYYAMFLVPLLGLTAAILLSRQRPPRAFYVRFIALGIAAGGIALGMVYPYFTARHAFDLERTLQFASSYDGKLSFFSHVQPTNLTLSALHHNGKFQGAHEEIAFPGFTVLALLVVALTTSVVQAWRKFGPQACQAVGLRWLLIGVASIAATLLAHSMLAGLIGVALGVVWQVRTRRPFPFSGTKGLYASVLVLSVVLFLGLEPLTFAGQPVHGLYYYFHTYFPGFNGIRKVSRQAVMTTFLLVVLSSFGSAWLISRLQRRSIRLVATGAFVVATCFELRTFPHPLHEVWAGQSVPSAYRFLATLPPEQFVASMPQNDGLRHFRGDAGMALCNYLALYHKHRIVNGQSSWMPPVTELVRRSLITLPSEASWRVLAAIGTRHLLIHGAELPANRRNVADLLEAQPGRYRREYRQGSDSVFSLVGLEDPTLELLDVPALPHGAQPIAASKLKASANREPLAVGNSIDGNINTYWSTRRVQARGDWYELAIDEPLPLVALELDTPYRVMDMPLSFDLSVSTAGGPWQRVAQRPALQLYRAQVHSPKTFVFRLVFEQPLVADRIRITLQQPMPGHALSVAEARVYSRSN